MSRWTHMTTQEEIIWRIHHERLGVLKIASCDKRKTKKQKNINISGWKRVLMCDLWSGLETSCPTPCCPPPPPARSRGFVVVENAFESCWILHMLKENTRNSLDPIVQTLYVHLCALIVMGVKNKHSTIMSMWFLIHILSRGFHQGWWRASCALSLGDSSLMAHLFLDVMNNDQTLKSRPLRGAAVAMSDLLQVGQQLGYWIVYFDVEIEWSFVVQCYFWAQNIQIRHNRFGQTTIWLTHLVQLTRVID